MSISATCRCCSALSRPYRLRLAHSTRSFTSSTSVGDRERVLPKTNWGAYKPPGPQAAPSDRYEPGGRSGSRESWGSRSGDSSSGGAGGGNGGGFGLNRGTGGPAGRPQRFGGGGDSGNDGYGRQNAYGGSRGNNDLRPRSFGQDGGGARGGRDSGGAPYASGFGLNKGGGGGGGGISHRGESSRNSFSNIGGRGNRDRGDRAPRDLLQDIRAVTNKSKAVPGGSADTAGASSSSRAQSTSGEEGDEVYVDEEGAGGGATEDRRKGRKAEKKANSRLALDDDDDAQVVFVRGKAKKLGEFEKVKSAPSAQELEWQKRKQQRDVERARQAQLAQSERTINIPSSVTVTRLATIFEVKLFRLQTRMNRLGMSHDQQRPDYMLTAEEACDIALEFGFNPVVDDEATFDIHPEPEQPGQVYPLRPPVVTIMGHVDHGKTTLLDALRNTAVAAGEAGGITQHIGAFSVPLKSLLPADAPPTDATITFLDTPGHASFSAMRARGASVTDIVVLVVAADDGVMPQTQEVLDLVKAEGDKVGLVVAINKIDKPGVDVAKVKSALGAVGVHLEEDGGDTQSVRVSGLAKLGLDNLVETLSLSAELREIRARIDGKAEGVVLESNVNRGAGRVTTILVTRGTLKTGSVVVAGQAWGKVRQMTDDRGNPLTSAGPGTPVVITGWKGDIPNAGEEVLEAVNGESEARKAVRNRKREAERKKLQADSEIINVKRREDRIKLDAEEEETKLIRETGGNVFEAKLQMAKKAAEQARDTDVKELRLVIKGDVSGTVEAVEGALSGIGNKEARVKVISTGVGEVTSWDVALAEASEALLIGFNVPCPQNMKRLAAEKKVECHLESVIYRLIETVRSKTAALLPPKIESRVLGEATVQKIFPIHVKKKTVQIAGCRVVNGEINKKDSVRVLRGAGRQKIFEGSIETLKHLKRDVDEVRKGTECGIQIAGFDDVKEGDEIVTFSTFEVAREL